MASPGQPLIFPVGHYVGAHYPRAGAELDFHVVRIGWEIYSLEGDEQFAVWALAHGVPGPDGDDILPWTRFTLEGAARASGVPVVPAVVDDLLAKDLIVEVTPGSSDAVEFAQVCRVRSLLIGLGNSADDPSHYGIGVADGNPIVQVPTFTYELWSWGHTCDSLWHTCQVLAQSGRQVAPGNAELTDPERVLARCLSAIQHLIAHGAVYLDEAREE